MEITKASRADVPVIVQLLADDKLGKLREDFRDPLPEKYYQAFDIINNDPNQELIVVKNDQDEIIGTLQLSFIQGLTHQGSIRAQIEAVRVREDQRGQRVGERLLQWVIQRAKDKGVYLLQLTTDKQRPDAIRFYERLGFRATHEGMKLRLS